MGRKCSFLVCSGRSEVFSRGLEIFKHVFPWEFVTQTHSILFLLIGQNEKRKEEKKRGISVELMENSWKEFTGRGEGRSEI